MGICKRTHCIIICPFTLIKQSNRDFPKIYTEELILQCTYHHSVLGFIFLVLSGCLQATKIHLKIKIAATNNSNHCCKNVCSQRESNPQLVLRSSSPA